MITNESNEKSGLLEGADYIDKFLKNKILILNTSFPKTASERVTQKMTNFYEDTDFKRENALIFLCTSSTNNEKFFDVKR